MEKFNINADGTNDSDNKYNSIMYNVKVRQENVFSWLKIPWLNTLANGHLRKNSNIFANELKTAGDSYEIWLEEEVKLTGLLI